MKNALTAANQQIEYACLHYASQNMLGKYSLSFAYLSLSDVAVLFVFPSKCLLNVFNCLFSTKMCKLLNASCNFFSSRLNLSPSPSQHAPISRTHVHATHKGLGKKRKHEGGTGLSPSYKVSQHSSTRGCVSIDEIDLDGKFIRLKNNSDLVRLSRSVTKVHEVIFFIRYVFSFWVQCD